MKYMNSAPFSDINTFVNSTNEKPVLKKPVRVSETIFVAIAEPIAEKLHIDESTWLEELLTSEGILLKISSKKIGSSPDMNERQRGQEKSLTKGVSKIHQTFPESRIRAEVI